MNEDNKNLKYYITFQVANLTVNLIASIALIFCCIYTIGSLSKDKESELSLLHLKDRRTLFEEASTLVGTRFRLMSNVIDKLNEVMRGNNLHSNNLPLFNTVYDKYRLTLDDYNIKVRIISKQLKYVFDDRISELFAKENDNKNTPISLSGNFQKLHNQIVEAKKYINVKPDKHYVNLRKNINKQNLIMQSKIINFMEILAEICFDKKEILKHIN